MFALEIAALFLFAYILYELWKTFTDPCKIPGPWGLPFIGYAPFLSSEPQKKLTILAKKYGNIYQMRIGSKRTVVISGYELVKEVGSRPEFANRQLLPPFSAIAEFNGGSSFSFRHYTERTLFLRKAAVRAMGYFTNSERSHLEDYTHKAIDSLGKDLETLRDCRFESREKKKSGLSQNDDDAKLFITKSVISVIGSLSIGQLFDKDSDLVMKIVEQNNLFGRIVGRVLIADLFPITRSLLLRETWQKFLEFNHNLASYIQGKIADHKQIESSGAIGDFQDAFDKVYFESKPDEMRRLSITKDAIRGNGQDLFAAGFITVTEHIFYALKLLGSRPDLQAELHQTVQSGCPNREEYVTLEHRSKMPYAEAFVEELLRHFSHTPFSLPHGTVEDVEFHGYFIPAGTVVLMNVYSVNHDPKIFENPERFDPHRFLNKQGEYDTQNGDHVLAFGYGKRKCVGEVIARREMFLFITNLIKRYEIKLTSFEGDHPMDTEFAFTLRTKSGTFEFIQRIEGQ